MTITELLDSLPGDADEVAVRLPKILVVDDDEALLRSLRRILKGRYEVQCESNPYRALVALEDDGPFAAIVSDLTMPGVDGIELLEQAHAEAPETPRILLTGNATLPASIEAVNRAHIDSFLTKPVAPDELLRYIDRAVAQHHELMNEFDSGSSILEGSAEALLETLSIANPTAASLTRRVTSLVDRYLEVNERGDAWEISLAARLCYLGSAALGADLSSRLIAGEALDDGESLLVGCVPAFTVDIVARIPRLANVEDILRHHRRRDDDPVHGRLPFGAQLLRIATALAEHEVASGSRSAAAAALSAEDGLDRRLVDAVLDLYLPVGEGVDVESAAAPEMVIDLVDADPQGDPAES